MTNRPDLIALLEKLTPTEGKWDNNKFVDYPYVTVGKTSFDVSRLEDDDIDLITLAPTMRLEILAMAKEIEELRNGVSVLMESHNKKDAEIKELKDKVQFWINSWNRLSKMYDQINSEITPQPK